MNAPEIKSATIPSQSHGRLSQILAGAVVALAVAVVLALWLDAAVGLTATLAGLVGLAAVASFWVQRQARLDAERLFELQAGELRDAKRRALIADEERRQFLTNMSHELRTPLAGILGLSEMLQRSGLESEEKRQLLLIQDSTRGLLAIVDDLLDVGKLGAGNLKLESRRVDMARLVEQTVSFLQPRAATKQVELRTQIDASVPPFLRADPTRVRQIVVNLLSNAIKFTERGHIEVRLHWSDAAELRLEVEDTGIGITDAARSRLFKPFQQADSSTSRRFGGTGLGLAICKSLAELMGGEIGVLSRRGEGSTFWVTLPLKPAEPASKEASPVTVGRDLSRRRVLVVEDDEVNRMVIVAKLEELGARVEVALDGPTGLERLESERFDLVLMDCQLPELDGYEVTRLLRRSGGPNTGVPVIALTAHTHEEERNRCFEAGMNDFLSKPVETALLYTTLRDWLDLAGQFREPSGVITLKKAI